MNSLSNKFLKISFISTLYNPGITNAFEKYAPLTVVPSRNTFILKRKYPVNLRVKGREDRPARLRRKGYVYELVEDTETKPHTTIPIVLKQYVEGIGEKGECVMLKKYQAYNKFLITGLADYATPEDVENAKRKNVSEETKSYSTLTAPLIAKYLDSKLLAVVMNKDVDWTIEPWHIRVAFRKAGMHVPEKCITLPEKPIKGPNLNWESKYFCVTVTINKREKATVRCRLHHWSTNLSERLPFVQYPWALPQEAIFPEDDQKLKELPLVKFKSINV